MDVIDHVAIVVDNIDVALSWYTKTFECEVEWHDESWALIAFQNCKLALVMGHQHPAHIAVLCGDAQRFGKPKMHRDGTRSVYCRDVDGNFVEFLERPSAFVPLDELGETDVA